MVVVGGELFALLPFDAFFATVKCDERDKIGDHGLRLLFQRRILLLEVLCHTPVRYVFEFNKR